MVPFNLPAWRKRFSHKIYSRKARIIASAVDDMESVMIDAVDSIIKHSYHTAHFHAPNLSAMDHVSERFYRSVVLGAYNSCQEEKSAQIGKKRLAKLPVGLPRNLNDIEKIFRDKRYWPKIMKRSKTLTERLRKSYLDKLKRKFNSIIPQIRAGETTPEIVKKDMMEAWDASKSRVETIFRTETTNYFGKTQVAFFHGDPDILGFMFDSIRDSARTQICIDRHGLIYRPDHTGKDSISYNTPALHYNCRSHLIALANTPFNRKLLEDKSRDPTGKSVAPLPPGWGGSSRAKYQHGFRKKKSKK